MSYQTAPKGPLFEIIRRFVAPPNDQSLEEDSLKARLQRGQRPRCRLRRGRQVCAMLIPFCVVMDWP